MGCALFRQFRVTLVQFLASHSAYFPMHKPPSSRVRFGAFEFDLGSGELRSIASSDPSDRGSNKVVLREQVFQVLRMLVEHEGKIVTREEIKNGLWGMIRLSISTKASMRRSKPCAVPWGIQQTTPGTLRRWTTRLWETCIA